MYARVKILRLFLYSHAREKVIFMMNDFLFKAIAVSVKILKKLRRSSKFWNEEDDKSKLWESLKD